MSWLVEISNRHLQKLLISLYSGLVGLAIAYALSVTDRLSGLVTSFTETEMQMVSVERAHQYIDGAPKEEEVPQTNHHMTVWPFNLLVVKIC